MRHIFLWLQYLAYLSPAEHTSACVFYFPKNILHFFHGVVNQIYNVNVSGRNDFHSSFTRQKGLAPRWVGVMFFFIPPICQSFPVLFHNIPVMICSFPVLVLTIYKAFRIVLSGVSHYPRIVGVKFMWRMMNRAMIHHNSLNYSLVNDVNG